GTWHHFCLALNEVSDFLVVDRCGAGNNCDEVTIETSQQITIEF
ncbi:MAG: ureidoglycolate lyase, partial [Psychrobium sp.]